VPRAPMSSALVLVPEERLKKRVRGRHEVRYTEKINMDEDVDMDEWSLSAIARRASAWDRQQMAEQKEAAAEEGGGAAEVLEGLGLSGRSRSGTPGGGSREGSALPAPPPAPAPRPAAVSLNSVKGRGSSCRQRRLPHIKQKLNN
jgi:hypothetical protein